jgi:hypothetical protein
VAVVDVLHQGFQRERDEEADRDDPEMQGDVAPGVDGFHGGVDVH